MKVLPTIEQNARFLMFHYLLWKHTNDPINLQLNTRNEIIDKWIFYCQTYQLIKEIPKEIQFLTQPVHNLMLNI
jgi:hypothetical protein